VEDFSLTPLERALCQALNRRGVRYLVVGMGAAALEGAPVSTQDVDLWFERSDDDRIKQAAVDAGGFFISGFGMQPPSFGGAGLERLDIVFLVQGLGPFGDEYANARQLEIDGVELRVLPLERVIASKRAARRPKDQAALPALEATLLARNLKG